MNVKTLVLSIVLAAPLAVLAGGTQTPPPAPAGEAEHQNQAQARADQDKLRADQEKLKEAQEKMRQAQKKVREKIIVMESRPRLGVVVNTDKNPDTDSIGALLDGVTPGGPADEAGLKAGDIIVKYNGVAMSGPYAAADEDESEPGIKLMDMARKLKNEDKVTLEFKRGSEMKTATIKAREIAPKDMMVLRDIKIPDFEIPDVNIPDIPELLSAYGPGRSLGMELAPLNADLGEYFGTTEGLLVLRAPKDETYKLKAGDVILRIGDRKPASPSQALRIFNSYEPGETVNVEVMRKQKKTALTFQMPERKTHSSYEWRSDGEAPEPPEPPEPPESPEPPAHGPGPSA